MDTGVNTTGHDFIENHSRKGSSPSKFDFLKVRVYILMTGLCFCTICVNSEKKYLFEAWKFSCRLSLETRFRLAYIKNESEQKYDIWQCAFNIPYRGNACRSLP